MKHIILVAIGIAIITSGCKKEPKLLQQPVANQVSQSYLSAIQKYVRQHVRNSDCDRLAFGQYIVNKQEKTCYMRIGFKNKLFSSDFILLQTDTDGNVKDGKIIHLERKLNNSDKSDRRIAAQTNYDGLIEISSLDRQEVLHSTIFNGYISAWHQQLLLRRSKNAESARSSSFPVPYDELPEVIVVAYISSPSSNAGISISDYIMLESMFSVGSSGSVYGGPGVGDQGSINGLYENNYGFYSLLDYGIVQSSSPSQYNPVHIPTLDESFLRPAINLDAWLKCFTDIPDAGSVSTITLCGDLPVDTDPNAGINLWNGNTGHCFLQLKKTNGAQSITQVIGFTAQSAGAAIINADAFVAGKTIDNAGHKYNCSITMNLTPIGLNTVMEKMKALNDRPYSIVNYDCLDYALEVFNTVRGNNPLQISKLYDPNDPFSNIATGPKLYQLLASMINGGSAEAPYISLGGPRNAGSSHGPCN